MINNKRSYTEYNITSPTTDFAIGFENYGVGAKDIIEVTLNGVLVESLGHTVRLKNAQVLEVTPAIEAGTVRLQRVTGIDSPFHKFTAGALFTAKSMDENFQQVRHSQQEVRDGFVFLEYNTNGIVQASKEATAQAKAATVEATASAVRAETAADTAVQAVDSLQGVVNAATTATTEANTATATATTAASQATAATTSAQNAAQAANTAKQEAAAAAANANAATVDTLAATGRANEAADVVADLVVGKVRAQDVSTADGSTQDVKNTEFRNELDALPFEDGTLADTFVITAVNGVGRVERTQMDINSDTVYVADFGATSGVLSDKFNTLVDAKTAYPFIAERLTTLEHSLFWCSLQTAIIVMGSDGGGLVHIPKGIYELSDPIYSSSNVTVQGNGRGTTILIGLNSRWNSRHIFYMQNADNFILRDVLIDQQGIKRTSAQATGASVVINKAKNSGVIKVDFLDASSMSAQASTPHVFIIGRDSSDTLTNGLVVGGVDGAIVKDCNFKMPDQNSRCAFAIRIHTDWLTKRPLESFEHRVENCIVVGNTFDGDYFWDIVELAGGGTVYNTVSYNRGRGHSTTLIDFDKGTSFNTASYNVAVDLRYPSNLEGNQDVTSSIFTDTGLSDYFNTGNKFLHNVCMYAESEGSSITESAFYFQNTNKGLYEGNRVENFNNGEYGSGIFIHDNVQNCIWAKNVINSVSFGIRTSGTCRNLAYLDFLDNEVSSSSYCVSFDAVEDSLIAGIRVSGGLFKTSSTTHNCVFVNNGRRFNDVTLANFTTLGGYDALKVGAASNYISTIHIINTSGRAFRLTQGRTSIVNSITDGQQLIGDFILERRAEYPTLINNQLRYNFNYNPKITVSASLPTSGTWNKSDRVTNRNVSAGGYLGWVCVKEGTLGTLADVYASTTANSADITLTGTGRVYVGEYISIEGVADYLLVVKVEGSKVTLNTSVTTAVSNATVSFSPAIFKGFGLVES